ncbi:MAG: DUF805 domain-containing protein [Bacteroidaceae bacterium]|nr:DUF805 domain-containing protein [Bacteroidaceae bacterium]
MIANFKNVLLNHYADFSGRARRREFWLFVLANFIIGFVLNAIQWADGYGAYMSYTLNSAVSGSYGTAGLFSFLGLAGKVAYAASIVYGLATIVPTLALNVRRLHDIGKSGHLLWLWLLLFVPLLNLLALIVLGILFIVWYCTDSQPGDNQYGPNPKGVGDYGNSHDDAPFAQPQEWTQEPQVQTPPTPLDYPQP